MSPERILLVHNAYQLAGGEDSVVADELALLRGKGHEVIEMRRDNQQVGTMGRASLAAQTLWSCGTQAEALALLREHRPDVVHVHNTFPLISPSLYWACAKAGVPVVQTLHNFRLACPQAMFLRDGKVFLIHRALASLANFDIPLNTNKHRLEHEHLKIINNYARHSTT